MTPTEITTTGEERDLLDAARGGDEDAFRRLVERHDTELRAHCYRMLGSLHDAEDALQDAFLRAWRGLPRFEGRSSARTWLYRIATNACLDIIARRPKRVLPAEYGPSAAPHELPGEAVTEPVWLEPYPDELLGSGDLQTMPETRYEQREAVELAFVAALQHLPARPRAVLILREVLGFSARETAESLETTVASVNSALQRARKTVDDRLPERSQQATLRSLGDDRAREIVRRYMDAMERADVDAVVSLMTEDATWSMPPLPIWYQGREAITAFLEDSALTVRWRHLPVRANGQLAVGCYAWNDDRRRYVAAVLDVLTLDRSGIAQITAFSTPAVFRNLGRTGTTELPSDVFEAFGLPEGIDP